MQKLREWRAKAKLLQSGHSRLVKHVFSSGCSKVRFAALLTMRCRDEDRTPTGPTGRSAFISAIYLLCP